MYAQQLRKTEVEAGILDKRRSDPSAGQGRAIGEHHIDGLFQPFASVWSDVFEQLGDAQTRTVEHLPHALLEGAAGLDGGRWISHIHTMPPPATTG